MDTLAKGTIENLVVDVADRLQALTDLTGLGVTFDVRRRSGTSWLIQNQAVSAVDVMKAFCLIDTTGSDWVPDVYELFLTISNPPETPRIGPMLFEVAYAMPEDSSGGGGGGGDMSPFLFKSTTISAADWAAFVAEPSPFNGGYGFTVIDAPGAGKYIYPIAATLMFIPDTTPYTLPAGASNLGVDYLQLGTPQMNDESTNWLQRDGGLLEELVTAVKPMFFKDQIANYERSWIENESLLLIIGAGPPTGGDGALRVDTYYSIVDF